MGYEPYYPGGWQSGPSGGTPMTPEALNHIENGIADCAPGGYGIGKLKNYSVASDADIDSELINQIGSMADQTFKRIVLSFTTTSNFTSGGGHWYTDIYKLSTNYAMITTKSYISDGKTVQRIWYGGELHPWEWINPPMIAGVEYRTTESWNGYPVYKKLVTHMSTITYGVSSGYTDYNIPHGISNFGTLKSVLARKGNSPLPYTMAVGTTFVKNVDEENIGLRAIGEWSPGYWYFELSYTKTE